MIKQLIEKGRKFYFEKKETYTTADVENIINQNTNFISSEYDNVITAEIDVFKASVSEAEQKNVELSTNIEALTKEKDEAVATFEKLNTEFEPIKKEQIKKTAKELLEGKVVPGAEYDAYAALKDKLVFEDNSNEIAKSKVINTVVGEYLKGKPYLKPDGETPPTSEKKEAHIIEKKPKSQTTKPKGKGWGYGG